MGSKGLRDKCHNMMKLVYNEGALDGGSPDVACQFQEMSMSPVALFLIFLSILTPEDQRSKCPGFECCTMLFLLNKKKKKKK